MRINKMFINGKMLSSFIHSTNSLRKCMEISLENYFVCGYWGLGYECMRNYFLGFFVLQ